MNDLLRACSLLEAWRSHLVLTLLDQTSPVSGSLAETLLVYKQRDCLGRAYAARAQRHRQIGDLSSALCDLSAAALS